MMQFLIGTLFGAAGSFILGIATGTTLSHRQQDRAKSRTAIERMADDLRTIRHLAEGRVR